MMHAVAQLSLFAFAALLTACVGEAPLSTSVELAAFRASVQIFPAANDVLFRALSLVGTPYRWGGNTPDSGFDCSGLVNFVYRDMTGIKLPRSTRAMLSIRAPSVPMQSLQTGDLVFFATAGGRNVSHAGIYIGEGRFVHAPRSGGIVRLDSLENSYWQRAYLGAKRVLAGPSPVALAP